MTYLIDTHILIWFVENDPKLSAQVRKLLEDTQHTVLISHASLWEMTIKKSIGKLAISLPLQSLVQQLAQQFIQPLSFQVAHYEILETLPFHHQDPFDRMLIAQAIAEGFTLITQDGKFAAYEPAVQILWNES
jgi:PIN domain nuclease of toxin-antitoxin system